MLTGCEGGSSSSATTTTKANGTPATGGGGGASIDACKLSEAQVSQVVGFQAKRETSGGGSGTCNFTADPSNSAHVGSSVSLNVNEVPTANIDVSQIIDGVAKSLKTTAEPVSGIADKAFFIDAGVVLELIAFKGNQQLTIAIGGLSGDSNTRKDQAKALANLLIG